MGSWFQRALYISSLAILFVGCTDSGSNPAPTANSTNSNTTVAPSPSPSPSPTPTVAPTTVSALTPSQLLNDRSTALQITGSNLNQILSFELRGPQNRILTQFNLATNSTLNVTVPVGLVAGTYDVYVNTAKASGISIGQSLTIDNLLDLTQNGAFKVGTLDSSIQGANGDSPSARIYYPALNTGANESIDLAGAPYPVLVYNHGFKPPLFAAGIDYRNNTFITETFASFGYIVICVDQSSNNFLFGSNATGQSNSERDAQDAIAAIDTLEQFNVDANHPLFGAIDTTKVGIAGHSRGGDASLMAAATESASANSRIRAVASFGAPSIDSQNNNQPLVFGDFTQVPALILGASEDTIAPFSQAQDIFNLAGPNSLIFEIIGGNHSQFKDSSSTILSDGSAQLSLTNQQQITRRYTLAFFNHHVKGLQGAFDDYLFNGTKLMSDTRLRSVSGK